VAADGCVVVHAALVLVFFIHCSWSEPFYASTVMLATYRKLQQDGDFEQHQKPAGHHTAEQDVSSNYSLDNYSAHVALSTL